MSKILSKDDILQARDVVIEAIEVPEWGGTVYVRSISAAERGLVEEGAAKFKENKGKNDSFARTFTVKMASMAMCDESGKRLFEEKDVIALQQKNAAVISRIAEVAQRLSGFSKQDIEELEKNLSEAQHGDSLSV